MPCIQRDDWKTQSLRQTTKRHCNEHVLNSEHKAVAVDSILRYYTIKKHTQTHTHTKRQTQTVR